MQSLDDLKGIELSRRSFVKCAGVLGATAAVYGCSKNDGSGYYYAGTDDDTLESDDIYYTKNPVFRYGTSTHNCGGRCVIRAQVADSGRIVRFLSDETKYAYDGTSIEAENRNNTVTRACARCRGYKGRLYHPGRLKYPLKQTKERGDMSGFKRVTWAEALEDITARLKAVQGKYGPESFHSIYACGNIGSIFQGANYGIFYSDFDRNNSDMPFKGQSPALRLLGGSTEIISDYSFHQASLMGFYGLPFSGMINMGPSADDIAGSGKYIVLWGSNIPTTNNTQAYSWVKGIEDMKKRDKDSKVLFIGPELSEGGVSIADEWIQSRPYTDVALILAMLHEMIINTVAADGTVNTVDPWLDLDYLDNMVYGFFDSPEYWLYTDFTDGTPTNAGSTVNSDSGRIVYSEPAGWVEDPGTYYIQGSDNSVHSTTASIIGDWTKVDMRWVNGAQYAYKKPYFQVQEVPDGCSLSAYIMGRDDRLTRVPYGSANYVAKTFTDEIPGITRNIKNCQYKVPQNTRFEYKKHIMEPKSAKWASEITGISEERIKELAKMYVDAAKNGEPIWNDWSGGMLKQAEGCATLFAIQMLCIISKNWGITGTGVSRGQIKRTITNSDDQLKLQSFAPASWGNGTIKAMPKHPRPSVVQWHNAIKFAFGDELRDNGYVPNIPDWKKEEGTDRCTATGKVYHGDGGTKALVTRNLKPGDPDPSTYTVTGSDNITRTYYDFEGRDPANVNHSPKYSGFRYIINSGGNIPVNQHMNCIDSAEMYKYLPTYGYGNFSTVMEDAFYLVTFDNFMSPSARYSDYVLPAKTSWEQEDFMLLRDGAYMYMDSVIPGPGESKSTWDFAREWVKTYGGATAAETFTGVGADTTFRQLVQKRYNEDIKPNSGSPFYNKSWDEFLEKPLLHPKPSLNANYTIAKHATRAAYERYMSDSLINKPTTPFYADISTVDASANGYSFGFDEFAETETCPQQSKRFHAYSGALKWRYENMFSKWHGYLPLGQQGQLKDDGEECPVVYPIVMYYDYNDYFIEAYGLNSKADLEGRYLLTTTHDRFRAHSSQSENPYLRELTHRTAGGGLYSGNDSDNYAIADNADGDFDKFPSLNPMIGEDGLPIDKEIASYSEIWVNTDDFAHMEDGTLVKVENEIGAVYCTLRKTKRCVKGFVGLHQGCWYDPRTVNSQIIDVGGNCNTLMASKPSRMDHGNAQQSAMVKITKVEG